MDIGHQLQVDMSQVMPGFSIPGMAQSVLVLNHARSSMLVPQEGVETGKLNETATCDSDGPGG